MSSFLKLLFGVPFVIGAVVGGMIVAGFAISFPPSCQAVITQAEWQQYGCPKGIDCE